MPRAFMRKINFPQKSALKFALTRAVGIFGILCEFLLSSQSFAAPNSLTYQGRIVKNDGVPLEYNNVSFVFKITDPSGTCILYQEQLDGKDMTNSSGIFDVPIGTGSISYPSSANFTVLDAFNNSSSFTCKGGATYNPVNTDGRLLRVSFYDGSGWNQVTPDNIIRTVPFAAYSVSAEKLGTNVASDFLLKAGLPTCGAGTFLTWSGSALTCGAVSGAAGGTVTNVTSANSYLSVATGTSIPALTVNVGTTAGTVAAGNDSRITGAMQSGASAGGALTGTYPNPSLASNSVGTTNITDSSVITPKLFANPGINRLVATDSSTGATLSALTCSANQLLTWSATLGWQCTNQTSLAVGSASLAANFTGSLVGDVTGTQGATVVAKINGYTVDLSVAPTANQVLTWNGTTWSAATLPTGNYITALTGDVTAAGPGSAAATIANSAVTNAKMANMAANTLKGNNTGAAAAPTDVTIASLQGTTASTFAAGNDSRIIGALPASGGTMTGMLTFATGSTTLSPLRIPAGASLVTTPVSGNVESDGSSLYWTDSTPTRQKLASYAGTPANGQLLIGNGTGFSLANVTAGSGVTVTNSAGGITIAATGSGGTVTSVTSSNSYLSIATGTSTPALTVNVGTAANTVAAGNDSRIVNALQTSTSFSGDVSGAYNATSVDKIKGKTVSAAPTLAGQVLRYDGTNLVPNFISMFDLRSTVTGVATFGSGSAGCTAGQTLTWTAATDNLACTNIAISNTQVSGLAASATTDTTNAVNISSGTLPAARMPALTGDVTTIAGTVVTTITNGAVTAAKLGTDVGAWATNGANIYRSSGNVGIGTTTPATDIELVNEGSNANLYLTAYGASNAGYFAGRSANGTIASPGNSLLNDKLSSYGAMGYGGGWAGTARGSMEIYASENWSSTNQGTEIRFKTTDNGSTSQTERIRITNSGNVGIGTTNPGSLLSIAGAGVTDGSIIFQQEINNTSTAYNSSPTTGLRFINIYNSSGIGAGMGGISVSKENATDGDYSSYLTLHTRANGASIAERLRISSSGNVGIGTTAPATALDIGGSNITGSAGVKLAVNNKLTTFGWISQLTNANSEGLFVAHTGSDGNVNYSPNLVVLSSTYATGGSYRPMVLATSDTPRVYIDTAGNVGIGTTSPISLFTVAGATSTVGAALGSKNPQQIITGGNTNNRLEFGMDNQSATPIGFIQSRNTATGAGLLSLNPSGGSVGIGTATPASNTSLQVVGYGVTSTVSSAGGYAAIYGITSDNAINGYAGFFNNTGSNTYCYISNTAAWNCASDARLKTNVETLPVLDRLENYRAVSFDWKKGGVHDVGVIAQELYKSFPEVVHKGSDADELPTTDEKSYFSDTWNVKYDRLGALALQAVKELYSKYTELNNNWFNDHQTIEQQNREIATLNTLVKKLETDSLVKDQKTNNLEKENALLRERLERIEKALNLN